MGYPDNEIIAGQIELGDRTPPPKSAREAAMLTRRQAKEVRQIAEARVKKFEREIFRSSFLLMFFGGLAGLLIGVVLGVAL